MSIFTNTMPYLLLRYIFIKFMELISFLLKNYCDIACIMLNVVDQLIHFDIVFIDINTDHICM